MADTYHTPSRRNLIHSSACLSLFIVSGCAAKDLPPGTFDFSEIKNPKTPKYYSQNYSPPKNKFKTTKFTHDGKARKIYSYMPKRRRVSSVLLLLHGSNRNGASMVDLWRTLAEQHGIALIAPDSFNKAHWSFENDTFEFMRTIVKDFMDRETLSELPIFGFGHSAGAIMMTHLSVRHGQYFKAIGTHAGNPTSSSLTRYKTNHKPRVPLIHILGDRDAIFDVTAAKSAAQNLVSQGQNVNLTIIKNHNHWYYDLAPFINKTAWNFMIAQ